MDTDFTSEEIQDSVDKYAQNHQLEFDAQSDTYCVNCNWAGCLLIPLSSVCRPDKLEGDLYVICSCGAEWWLDFEPPKCGCSGDDPGSRLEFRKREK